MLIPFLVEKLLVFISSNTGAYNDFIEEIFFNGLYYIIF